VERAVIMSEDHQLKAQDFVIHQKEQSVEAVFDHLNLEKLEEWAIRKVIARHQGNVSYAAKELGLSRGALYRRMEYYGI
jgi:transcriptional regulator of acetoin/glycerol metabolism